MNSVKHVALLAFAGGLATLPAADPDLPYVSGSTGADGDLNVPASLPNRYDFAAAYDAARNETVVFSGYDSGGDGRTAGYRPETYTFNGTAWTKEEPATFVSARYDSKMVYDPVRQEVLLFGGRRADNAYLNDTWIWNGTDWTEKSPAASPSIRSHHEMVWDPINNRVLLFGGQSPTDGWLEDMWAWNGTNWAAVPTTNTPEADFAQQDYGEWVWQTSSNRAIYYNEWSRKTYAFTGDTWSQITSAQVPNHGRDHRMTYDPVRNEVITTSAAQTWVFKNDEWSQKSPETNDASRAQHGLVWDSSASHVLTFGGSGPGGRIFQDTRNWDGTTWTPMLGRNFVIDLNEKPTGIYNYGSITVPPYVQVSFIRNITNTPVTWLATGEVLIDGVITLNGQSGPTNDFSGQVARGGPGGFDGGAGGIRFDVSGEYPGTPGQGPGGGEPPTEPRQQGTPGLYTGVYGNSLIQPLVGGSGASGGSSSDTANGGNGGAGGGAILIATSRDIEINGSILANGGARGVYGGASYGGYGSGGAVRLVADRIVGNGNVEANGPSTGGEGRVRIEAFFRPFAPKTSPVPSATAPVQSIDFTNQPTLLVTSVDGANVANPPSGSIATPDVIFTDAGVVTITVRGTDIPAGTPVTLRITSGDGVIKLPAEGAADVTLSAGGTATFSTMVPKGAGTIQAFAEFTLTE